MSENLTRRVGPHSNPIPGAKAIVCIRHPDQALLEAARPPNLGRSEWALLKPSKWVRPSCLPTVFLRLDAKDLMYLRLSAPPDAEVTICYRERGSSWANIKFDEHAFGSNGEPYSRWAQYRRTRVRNFLKDGYYPPPSGKERERRVGAGLGSP